MKILVYALLMFQPAPADQPSSSDLPAQDSVLVLTLNSETDQTFGDFYESNKHIEKIAELLNKLKNSPPKSVGVDLLLGGSESLDQARNQFFSQIEAVGFPVVLGLPVPISEDEKLHMRPFDLISFGHCYSERVRAPRHSLGANALSETSADYQLSTRSLIESSLAYEVFQLGSGQTLAPDFNSIRINLTSEETFQKIPLQEALKMSEEDLRKNFTGRYILVGADYDKIDIKSSGVNGVFYLAEALSTYIEHAEIQKKP